VPVPEACADWVRRSTGSGISCATALTGGYFSQMLRLELDEQRRALLESWTGPERTVVVRTLDAGSDKPVAFATVVGEENLRWASAGCDCPSATPVSWCGSAIAIALAAKQSGTTPWVMAPMVATVEGAQVFADQVRERGLRAGVMVEVPGSALLAHRFLEVVDFQSIGTKTT